MFPPTGTYRNDYLSQEDPDIAYKMYGVIRLADMLEVHPLKERILSRIKQDWLSIKSAQDWTRKLQFYRSFEPEDEYDPDKYTLEPASVLRVAREFDSSLITPVLFYFLASCESHAIHGNFEEEERGIRLKSAARWDLMSSTDRVKVMEGHSAILDWVSMELDSLDLECANHQTKCRAVLRSTLRSVYKTILRGIDPLRALMLSRSHHFETVCFSRCLGCMYLTVHFPIKSIMCKTCAHTWNLNLNVFREKLFDQLEDIFDTIHN